MVQVPKGKSQKRKKGSLKILQEEEITDIAKSEE